MQEIDGSDSDSLWFSQTNTRENMRDAIIIERAGHDFAGKRVLYDCQECPYKRRYLTLVRKVDATIVYVCAACGAQYDHHMQKQKINE
jgi:transcription elongation factor Elf1